VEAAGLELEEHPWRARDLGEAMARAAFLKLKAMHRRLISPTRRWRSNARERIRKFELLDRRKIWISMLSSKKDYYLESLRVLFGSGATL
jgi:hypothetical protein